MILSERSVPLVVDYIQQQKRRHQDHRLVSQLKRSNDSDGSHWLHRFQTRRTILQREQGEPPKVPVPIDSPGTNAPVVVMRAPVRAAPGGEQMRRLFSKRL